MNDIMNMPGLESLKDELRSLEMKVLTEGYTLADAIRDGSRHTEQMLGDFTDVNNNRACALSAAAVALKARFDG